jgi:hypothetical protein
MALCHECDARIEYTGNGTQRDYTFPFEYYEESEIYVSVYNPETYEYDSLTFGTDWTLVNATTVRLNKAVTESLIIYRCTDLDQMRATFYPGHPVKAQDLNDDFLQLRNAIEEGKCTDEALKDKLDEGYTIWLNRIDADTSYKGMPGDLVKSSSKLTLDDDHVASTKWIDNRYWDQCEETTYSYDNWFDEIDDVHVPTTRAVEQRLSDFDALTGVQKVTGNMQREQKWDDSVTDDFHVATTDAIVERLDNYVANENTEYPDSYWLQPGKLWIKHDTAELFYRRDTGKHWVQLDTKGDRGEQGDKGEQGEQGPPGLSGHIGENPPTDKYPGQLWFNTKCPSGLYVWDGTQWIGVSLPGPQGPKGDTGSGMDAADLTAKAPIVATTNVVNQTAELSMNIDLLPPI